jgi:catechol 2,3-dioxygenase-like lactoylglutathione lyase family enzyme
MSLDLDQIDLVSADPEASLEFYRRLGVEIPDEAVWRTGTGVHHIDVTLPSGVILLGIMSPSDRAAATAPPSL